MGIWGIYLEVRGIPGCKKFESRCCVYVCGCFLYCDVLKAEQTQVVPVRTNTDRMNEYSIENKDLELPENFLIKLIIRYTDWANIIIGHFINHIICPVGVFGRFTLLCVSTVCVQYIAFYRRPSMRYWVFLNDKKTKNRLLGSTVLPSNHARTNSRVQVCAIPQSDSDVWIVQ